MRRAVSRVMAGVLALSVTALSHGAGAAGAAAKPKEGDLYVSLGSSISSGFGISEQSQEGCGRSDRSYPNLVAERFKLELVDVSCGAASIVHVLDSPQGDNPVQISAVTPDTKLITISIGGNDIGYNGTALGCGNPATTCSAPATLDENIEKLRVDLKDMLDQLEAAAPDATIVFVTYPREVPKKNCDALSFTDEEFELVGSMGKRLEKVFRDVAKRPGIVFVDPYAAKGDHTGCAPESKRWTAPYEVAEGEGFAYHPTALGHEVMAKMIIKALNKRS